MKILLTGGSGFIGKNLRESFIPQKYELLSPTSKELNLVDTASVDEFFRKNRVDVVIHAATKPGHRNAKDLSNLFYTNTRMFLNLERHKDEYSKMLVMGSGAIYDYLNYRPKMSEDDYDKYIPTDEHGFCKYTCEKIIETSSNIYDMRIFGIFGKYEDYAIRFISNAICKSLFDLPITIRQDRRFDYLYVNDLANIIDTFIEHKPQYHAYNITPRKSILLSELADVVCKISGKRHEILITEHEIGLEYSGNNNRLCIEFDPVFTAIEDSVLELFNWYKNRKDELDINLLMTDK